MLPYPKYFASQRSADYLRNGMSTYQRGKRTKNRDVMAVGALMIQAGGGSVMQCAAPSKFIWRLIGTMRGEKGQQSVLDRVAKAQRELKEAFTQPKEQ